MKRQAILTFSARFGAIAMILGSAWSMPLAGVELLAGTTALIIGGTGHPMVNPDIGQRYVFSETADGPIYGYPVSEPGLVGAGGIPDGYVAGAAAKYVLPAVADVDGFNIVAVWNPGEFWPVEGLSTFDDSVAAGVGNLDRCIRGLACIAHPYPDGSGPSDTYAVFAFSQSARVASIQKAMLIGEYNAQDPATYHHVSFVLIGNPNRPNGGILERFNGIHIPILNVTFDGATPTASPIVDGNYLYPTADISRQYDGWSDFPANPLNLLADINAVAGIAYLHPDYFVGSGVNQVGSSYRYQGQQGDTNYYLIPSARLPMLEPLAQLGVPTPVLAAFDAPLRVVIEWGYDRDVAAGEPTPANIFGARDVAQDLTNLAVAIPTGWDDGLALAAHDPTFRPFKTKPVTSIFGVGGSDLPETTTPSVATKPNDPPELVTVAGASLSERPAIPGGRPPSLQLKGLRRPELTRPPASRLYSDRRHEKLFDALHSRRPVAATAGDPGDDRRVKRDRKFGPRRELRAAPTAPTPAAQS